MILAARGYKKFGEYWIGKDAAAWIEGGTAAEIRSALASLPPFVKRALVVAKKAPKFERAGLEIEFFTPEFLEIDLSDHPDAVHYDVVDIPPDPALPIMRFDDAARRFWGWPVGTVVRCRESGVVRAVRRFTDPREPA